MTKTTAAPADGAPVELARHLGVFEATMIGVGAMIGAGIFVLTGLASGVAGPAALLAFGLNGVVTLFTALSYAELSSRVPEAGGGYSFVKRVMPNPVAFAAGWMLWFAYVVACSLYAKGFGSYFLEFFDRYLPSISEALVAGLGHEGGVVALTLGIGLLFLAINVVGAHASGQAENVMTLLKIAILSVFIAFGVVAIVGDPQTTSDNFTPFLPRGVGGVLGAMGLTFIAFEGYDLIATVSEEVSEPRRTIPRAILYSLAITVAIYLLVVFVALGAVPPEGGVPTWQALGDAGEIGIVTAAEAFMPTVGVVIVLAGGLFATLSALNATILASSRVAFAMGRDWMLPNRLSRLHPTRRTPVLAIVLSGVLFLGMAVTLPLETIGTASSLLFLITFALVNVSLILYRRRSPGDPDEGFSTPLFPLVPVLGVLTTAGLAGFQLVNQPVAALIAAGWIAVGIGIYVVFFRTRVRVADIPRFISSPELRTLVRAREHRTLVAVSHPERVEPLVTLGSQIARASGGELLALKVVDLPDVTAYADADPFVEEAQRVLARAQQHALTERVEFSSLLKVGRSPGPEIVEVARRHDCDLILMGYKQDEDPLENSVIQHVSSNNPCDVAILKSDRPGPFRRLLLPLGGKEVHDRLKARIVHSIAAEGEAEVTLLTVTPDGGGRAEQRAHRRLDRAARLYDLRDAGRVVETGDDPAEAIIHSAAEHDLVILGVAEESFLEAFFFGRLAQRVAAQVDCPILLTKSQRPRGRRTGLSEDREEITTAP